jgi:hypothetical protein
MPLDSRKIDHIKAVTLRTFQSRQKVVVFVYQSGSSYTYTATSVIFRPQDIIDPEIPNVGGAAPKLQADMLCAAPIGTPTTGLVYIADTSTATALAAASAAKYQPIEIVPVGIIPTGTRIMILLRRLR